MEGIVQCWVYCWEGERERHKGRMSDRDDSNTAPSTAPAYVYVYDYSLTSTLQTKRMHTAWRSEHKDQFLDWRLMTGALTRWASSPDRLWWVSYHSHRTFVTSATVKVTRWLTWPESRRRCRSWSVKTLGSCPSPLDTGFCAVLDRMHWRQAHSSSSSFPASFSSPGLPERERKRATFH